MPDGRKWTNVNLNFPLLGYRYPGAPKKEGRLYKFLHVQIINFLLKFFLTGWHIPTDAEWSAMLDAVGPDAGTKLKSKTGWKYDGNGTDEFGFGAVPAGARSYNGSQIYGRGTEVTYWSSSVGTSSAAWYRPFYYNSAQVYRNLGSRSNGLSVRCVRDVKD
jgi:uncharacterized protein (TIGR02145 family)